MGLYDRDYVRTEPSGNWFADRPAIVQIIFISGVVFLLDVLLFDKRLRDWLALSATMYREPWLAYQLLTYGFVHSTASFAHVFFNMYMLYLFGYVVEDRLGRAEIWRVYLVALAFCGLVWLLLHLAFYPGQPAFLIGASGAVTCVLLISVRMFPQRIILLMLVLPIPAWLLGVLYVVGDIIGFKASVEGVGPPIAYEAHLAGAVLGLCYVQFQWNFGRWTPDWGRWKRTLFGPRLRVHRDTPGEGSEVAMGLNERVDRILEKISQQGSDSLTPQERRILEDASRRYQRRRQ